MKTVAQVREAELKLRLVLAAALEGNDKDQACRIAAELSVLLWVLEDRNPRTRELHDAFETMIDEFKRIDQNDIHKN